MARKSKKKASPGKQSSPGNRRIGMILLAVGILLVVIGGISLYMKNRQGAPAPQKPLVLENRSELPPPPKETEVIQEYRLDDAQVNTVKSGLDKGLSVVLSDYSITLGRGESKTIAVGFANRLLKTKYFYYNANFGSASSDNLKIEPEVILEQWINPGNMSVQVLDNEQKIFPVRVTAPRDAVLGVYNFYVNICWFNPDRQEVSDSGCTIEQNSKLGSSQKIEITVK